MIMCSVHKAAKMYGGNTIFEDISFEIKEKERIGLTGRNGGGKTTLIRLLAGEETPDAGQIHWKKGAAIGYLHQIPEYYDETITRDVFKTAFRELLQVEEQMKKLEVEMGLEKNADKLQRHMSLYGVLQDQYAADGGYEIEASMEKIAHGLNIFSLLEQPFSKLSGGEKTKVGLGVMLLKQPDLLLLDEPTNHLDLQAVEWLGGFLKEYSGTVLVISHDRFFLDETVNKIIDLEDGEIAIYHTNFTGFVKEKEERLLTEFKAYDEQQKKIKKMKEAIKRLKDWANRANPPSDSLHKRARNMERALERMEKLQRPVRNRKKMGLAMDVNERSGKDVLLLTDVSKRFPDKLLFKNVHMHINHQDRAAIIGENGTGKSTLLKLILRELSPDSGKIHIGSNVKIGYLSQNVFADASNETVIEMFREVVMATEGEARRILAKFMFYGYSVFHKVSSLSGGEKMRLRLAQLMYQDINLLILDEPTNHLDIDSREVLEDVLEGYQGSLLAVSHDRYFLNKLFNKIYWIESGRISCFTGSYTRAKEKMAEQRQRMGQTKLPAKINEIKGKKTRHANTGLEQRLQSLEEKVLALDHALLYTDDLEEKERLTQDKINMEQKWEELCDQLES